MPCPASHPTLRTGSKLPCAATLSSTCLLPPFTRGYYLKITRPKKSGILCRARHPTLRTGSKLPCAATLSPTCLLPPITIHLTQKVYRLSALGVTSNFSGPEIYIRHTCHKRAIYWFSQCARTRVNFKDPVQIRLFYYISDSFQLKRRAYSCSDLTSQVLADFKHITSVNPRVSVSIAVYSEGFKPITNLAIQIE